MNLKELIVSVSSLMSISGSERYSSDKLFELIGDKFDEFYCDNIGNHIFVKKCGRENAPKILIDCHFDEVGMMVSSIKEGGFLSVEKIGGIDPKILQSGEVTIYGKEEIYGVFCATAPHLLTAETANKLIPLESLLIDTGYSKEELEKIVRIGTPVGFKPVYTELLGGMLAGKGFDNKACGACAVAGIDTVSRDELVGDIYFTFSTREEVGLIGGYTSAYSIDPDYALVLDVTHAYIPEMKNKKYHECGCGVAVEVSAVTNRGLAKMAIELCKEKKIPYVIEPSPNSTGTNANKIPTVRHGIPTLLVSLPLKNMHTQNEVISLDDCAAMADFVSEFIKCEEIAEVYSR